MATTGRPVVYSGRKKKSTKLTALIPAKRKCVTEGHWV
jgi:hypothetical protein